jgi:hypothetical protein
VNLVGFNFGYFFNGWIHRSRQEKWRPEYRLHGVWFAIGTMAAGLLTYGLTLHFHKHWIGLAFGWGMVVAGMIASTVYVNRIAKPAQLEPHKWEHGCALRLIYACTGP